MAVSSAAAAERGPSPRVRSLHLNYGGSAQTPPTQVLYDWVNKLKNSK